MTYLQRADLERECGISRREVERWTKAGIIAPSSTSPGGHGRYTPADVRRVCLAKILRRHRASLPFIRKALPGLAAEQERLVARACGDTTVEDVTVESLMPQEIGSIGGYCLYFVQAWTGGPVAIGLVRELEKRLAQLQVGNAEELRLCAWARACAEIRTEVHERLVAAQLWVSGEWFHAVPGLAELARRLVDRQGGEMRFDLVSRAAPR